MKNEDFLDVEPRAGNLFLGSFFLGDAERNTMRACFCRFFGDA